MTTSPSDSSPRQAAASSAAQATSDGAGGAPFSWDNRHPTVRTPVFARNVVATSQPLAAQAAGLVVEHDPPHDPAPVAVRQNRDGGAEQVRIVVPGAGICQEMHRVPFQNRKYRCASGSSVAGSQVRSWPSARTS